MFVHMLVILQECSHEGDSDAEQESEDGIFNGVRSFSYPCMFLKAHIIIFVFISVESVSVTEGSSFHKMFILFQK